MDESQVPLEADLQEFDEVLLSDRAFDTDPSRILLESLDEC
jgi:putative transposase